MNVVFAVASCVVVNEVENVVVVVTVSWALVPEGVGAAVGTGAEVGAAVAPSCGPKLVQSSAWLVQKSEYDGHVRVPLNPIEAGMVAEPPPFGQSTYCAVHPLTPVGHARYILRVVVAVSHEYV